jgi:hypothetical protein
MTQQTTPANFLISWIRRDRLVIVLYLLLTAAITLEFTDWANLAKLKRNEPLGSV